MLRSFKSRDIDVHTGVAVTGHTPRSDGSGTVVAFGEGETLDVDMVVVSVGRRPLSDSLGLEGTAGRGRRPRLRRGRRVLPHRRAGRLRGRRRQSPRRRWPTSASPRASSSIQHLLGEAPIPVDYARVPWCIYCHPEVAFAGHSEQSAKDAGFDVVVSKHRYIGNGRALIVGETDGMVKIIAAKNADGTAGQILGVHMVGPWVTEQLGQGYLAVNWEATVDEVAQFIQPHPTLSELFGESVMALTGRGLHG